MQKARVQNSRKKLVVMIPCYNEEATIASVIGSIPKSIPGISKLDILIIDDGSTDKTVKIAKSLGVKHFVHNEVNKGLARSFVKGLNAALELGADIIVNTDGDNQYPQKDIPRLIQPILDNKAHIVIGDRQTHKIAHFSPTKKLFQKFGSAVVRKFSHTDVPDAVSGFRAFSREVAMRLNVFTDYTYTIETLIQAGRSRFTIVSVPIVTNSKNRESRLVKSIFSYLKKSASTMFKIFAIYEPLKVFTYIGMVVALPGLLVVGRFVYYYSLGEGNGHIQSIVLGSIIVMIGFQIILFGLIASLIAVNRRLAEENLYYMKRMVLAK